MASDPPKTSQTVRHVPHAQVQHAHPDLAVSVNHIVSSCCLPPDRLSGSNTDKRFTSWAMPLTALAARWNRNLSTTAFYEAHSGDVVGSSQSHLFSIDRCPTFDPDEPHLVSNDRHPLCDPSESANPTFAWRPLDSLPGLDSTDECSVASWTSPHMAQATTTAAYDLPPTPVTWPRLYDPEKSLALAQTTNAR